MSDANSIRICQMEEASFPKTLRALSGMPKLLYYRGNIEIINHYKNVAVIGSRKVSGEGMQLSYIAGREAARNGLNLVNGLALGCDTEAIKGALSVGGRCIAIMPCGLEQIQPRSNTKLAQQILENGGCILSEYPEGTAIHKYQYVARDRLQSGISQAILVVEAEANSGTMHTADFAVKQYKRLACYASKILELSSGNRYLENTGKAFILKDKNDTSAFMKSILEEAEYEQMTFDFGVNL